MEKVYSVYLGSKQIGTTKLENADPPMGVVSGIIVFNDSESPYQLFKDYCSKNNVTINTDEPEFELIDTQAIKDLNIFRPDGLEIKGQAGNTICGMKEEGYEISILGIAYPFYEEEFPHHVKAYRD